MTDRLVSTYSTPQLNDLTIKNVNSWVPAMPSDDVYSLFRIYNPKPAEISAGRVDFFEINKERGAGNKFENQKHKVLGLAEGYKKSIYRVTAGASREATDHEFKALTEKGLTQLVVGLADDIQEKITLDLRNFIGLGTGTGYTTTEGQFMDTTTADGQPMFSTTHKLKQTSQTYSNIASGNPKITEGGLILMERYFRNSVKDNYGKLIAIKPDTIITTSDPAIVKKVNRLLNSVSPMYVNDTTSGNGTQNSNSGVVNVNRNRYSHKVVDFDYDIYGERDASKTFYWMLASLKSIKTRPELYYIKFSGMNSKPVIVDHDRGNRKWVMNKDYGIGAVNAKGMILSKATSA